MATARAKCDATIRGCLDALRKGDIFAVGILADWLEENQLPHATRVRQMWARYERRRQWFATADLTRRKSTHWEIAGRERNRLRSKVARLYGCWWKPLPLILK